MSMLILNWNSDIGPRNVVLCKCGDVIPKKEEQYNLSDLPAQMSNMN